MSAQVVASRGDLEPGEALRLELEDSQGHLVDVALVLAEDGSYYAIADRCSHGAVALSDGEIEGTSIECWLHGSTFDLSTGKPQSLPATTAIPTYPVTFDGTDILIDVDAAQHV